MYVFPYACDVLAEVCRNTTVNGVVFRADTMTPVDFKTLTPFVTFSPIGGEEVGVDRFETVNATVYLRVDGTVLPSILVAGLHSKLMRFPHFNGAGSLDYVTCEQVPGEQAYPDPELSVWRAVYRTAARPVT